MGPHSVSGVPECFRDLLSVFLYVLATYFGEYSQCVIRIDHNKVLGCISSDRHIGFQAWLRQVFFGVARGSFSSSSLERVSALGLELFKWIDSRRKIRYSGE